MESELKLVSAWIGRHVTTEDGDAAVVLAVDDTPYAPSAWIKYDRYPPAYQSVDLSDVADALTGEPGPRWGTGGPDAHEALMRARLG